MKYKYVALAGIAALVVGATGCSSRTGENLGNRIGYVSDGDGYYSNGYYTYDGDGMNPYYHDYGYGNSNHLANNIIGTDNALYRPADGNVNRMSNYSRNVIQNNAKAVVDAIQGKDKDYMYSTNDLKTRAVSETTTEITTAMQTPSVSSTR